MINHIEKFLQLLNESKNTVVLTGAGISTNAGIPDFRGPQGLYVSRRYDAEKIFDIDYFAKDPKPFYEFAYDFISLESTIKPTLTHQVLATLEQKGKIKAIVTQNIDGLHQKAGSQKVLEMHGSFLTSHCRSCKKSYDYDQLKMMVFDKQIARCSCQGVIKPDIVFFGENVQYYREAFELAQKADLFLVLGTSCAVYPAASLPQVVTGKIVIVNHSKINLNMYNVILEIESDTDIFFKELMGSLESHSNK